MSGEAGSRVNGEGSTQQTRTHRRLRTRGNIATRPRRVPSHPVTGGCDSRNTQSGRRATGGASLDRRTSSLRIAGQCTLHICLATDWLSEDSLDEDTGTVEGNLLGQYSVHRPVRGPARHKIILRPPDEARAPSSACQRQTHSYLAIRITACYALIVRCPDKWPGLPPRVIGS